jgi:hypothetical protein
LTAQLGTYTLPRHLALVRVYRSAKSKAWIGRPRAAWIALKAACASHDRRTVTVRGAGAR